MKLADDVIARARRGDRSAQRAFVNAYQGPVYALCAAFAGNDAEDLAQEALVRALGQLPRFDPRGAATLATFVLRIARNLCIDRARSARVQRGAELDLDRLMSASRADHELSAAQDAERVRLAVLALPDDQRAAIALRMWGELDYGEIAAIEDVPVGTVRSRLARARDALRTALDPDREEVARAG